MTFDMNMLETTVRTDEEVDEDEINLKRYERNFVSLGSEVEKCAIILHVGSDCSFKCLRNVNDLFLAKTARDLRASNACIYCASQFNP